MNQALLAVTHSSIFAAIFVLGFSVLMGFVASRVTSLVAQGRLLRFSALVTGFFVAMALPAIMENRPPGEGGADVGFLHGTMVAASYISILLGFLVVPISGFLLLMAVFAWLFSTFLPQRDPPQPFTQNRPSVPDAEAKKRQGFGRRSKDG